MPDIIGLSYNTVKGLNGIIDTKLPGRPPFRCKIVNIGGERLEFHFRDVIGCIQSLYSDPRFTHDMAFAPEQHYSNPERTCRVYNELYTGDWWWKVQVRAIYSDEAHIDLLCRLPSNLVNQGQQ